MRVQLVDPPAFTPPYDRSLAGALARAGVDVELVTSRFLYGTVPAADGYEVNEMFYRRSGRRRLLKLAEHAPDMLRYGRHAGRADLVHWQWLIVEQLDAWLMHDSRTLDTTALSIISH